MDGEFFFLFGFSVCLWLSRPLSFLYVILSLLFIARDPIANGVISTANLFFASFSIYVQISI